MAASSTDDAVADFVATVSRLPLHSDSSNSFQNCLQRSLDFERALRIRYVSDTIEDLYAGLIDIFATPSSFRQSRPRVITTDEDVSAHYLMPLSSSARRVSGSPCVVDDIGKFRDNWLLFSHGVMQSLTDWSNIVVAGGSVLASLIPLDATSVKDKLGVYHSEATMYASSDIDIFLWGLTPAAAETKIKLIANAVCDSVPWEVVCVRKVNTISLHTQYPYRTIQIVLRLYQSPAEILAGFDIDACAVCFDGDRVWVNPRSIAALIRQCNTIDLSRRSPSYEFRLAKYAMRGFEIMFPSLNRDRLNIKLYDPDIMFLPHGLARLVLLERMREDPFYYDRFRFPGTPAKFEPKDGIEYVETKRRSTVIPRNNYDHTTFVIPYGLGWDAKRVKDLVQRIEKKSLDPEHPLNCGQRLHRYSMFVSEHIEDCLEDFCKDCPLPQDMEEEELQRKEDKVHIRGRIRFITNNPGHQMQCGSFNPITTGNWTADAYYEGVGLG